MHQGEQRVASLQQKWLRRHILLTIALSICILVSVIILFLRLQFYPGIPSILLVYIPVLLWIRQQRGLGLAVLVAIMAWVSFNFFFLPPLFTLVRVEEGVSFIVFLLLVLMIERGFIEWYQITRRAYLQKRERRVYQREQEVYRREREIHAFYELVHATNDVSDLQEQLQLIMQAIIDNFSIDGVMGCAIYLPGEGNKPVLQAVAAVSNDIMQTLSCDDDRNVTWVLAHGGELEVWNAHLVDHGGDSYIIRVVGDTKAVKTSEPELEEHILPLCEEKKLLGAFYLALSNKYALQLFRTKKGVDLEGIPQLRTEFSQKMLRLAISVIERARVQQKTLDLELLQRTEQLYTSVMSTLSHDLRTPLATIKGYATHLYSNVPDDDVGKREKYLERIEQEVNRLDRFICKLINFSRIEGGMLRPNKELCYIDDLIHDTLIEMEPYLQDRVLEVMIPELPPIELDTILIGHVLENLLGNALHHTACWTSIEVSAQLDDGCIQVTIADRGPGINPDDIHSIFDKFYRSPDSTGMGLGLTICRGMIDAHDGQIWAENREGGGALFRFRLPLTKEGGSTYAKKLV